MRAKLFFPFKKEFVMFLIKLRIFFVSALCLSCFFTASASPVLEALPEAHISQKTPYTPFETKRFQIAPSTRQDLQHIANLDVQNPSEYIDMYDDDIKDDLLEQEKRIRNDPAGFMQNPDDENVSYFYTVFSKQLPPVFKGMIVFNNPQDSFLELFFKMAAPKEEEEKGIGTESLQGLLKHLHEINFFGNNQSPYQGFYANVNMENLPSLKCLPKLGAKVERFENYNIVLFYPHIPPASQNTYIHEALMPYLKSYLDEGLKTKSILPPPPSIAEKNLRLVLFQTFLTSLKCIKEDFLFYQNSIFFQFLLTSFARFPDFLQTLEERNILSEDISWKIINNIINKLRPVFSPATPNKEKQKRTENYLELIKQSYYGRIPAFNPSIFYSSFSTDNYRLETLQNEHIKALKEKDALYPSHHTNLLSHTIDQMMEQHTQNLTTQKRSSKYWHSIFSRIKPRSLKGIMCLGEEHEHLSVNIKVFPSQEMGEKRIGTESIKGLIQHLETNKMIGQDAPYKGLTFTVSFDNLVCLNCLINKVGAKVGDFRDSNFTLFYPSVPENSIYFPKLHAEVIKDLKSYIEVGKKENTLTPQPSEEEENLCLELFRVFASDLQGSPEEFFDKKIKGSVNFILSAFGRFSSLFDKVKNAKIFSEEELWRILEIVVSNIYFPPIESFPESVQNLYSLEFNTQSMYLHNVKNMMNQREQSLNHATH